MRMPRDKKEENVGMNGSVEWAIVIGINNKELTIQMYEQKIDTEATEFSTQMIQLIFSVYFIRRVRLGH